MIKSEEDKDSVGKLNVAFVGTGTERLKKVKVHE